MKLSPFRFLMPPFQQLAKFAGFASKAAEESAEVNSFFRKLGISTEGSMYAETSGLKALGNEEHTGLHFEHVTEGEKRVTYLRKGTEQVGHLTFDLSNPAAPRIAGTKLEKAYRGHGLGIEMYQAGFKDIFATIPGAEKVTSDTMFGTDPSAKRVWESLRKRGLDVKPSAPLSLPGSGAFIEEQGYEVSRRAVMTQVEAIKTSQDMLKAGAGSDNTTMLRRSMKSQGGSRRTSGAL